MVTLRFPLSLPFASAHRPLGLRENCPQIWRSPGADEVGQEEVEETFLPIGGPHHSLSLMDVSSSTFLLRLMLG